MKKIYKPSQRHDFYVIAVYPASRKAMLDTGGDCFAGFILSGGER